MAGLGGSAGPARRGSGVSSLFRNSSGTGPGEGSGRWATRAGAVRGAWRPAARSGGGRRAAPLQCGDPLAVPASPRPRVPA